jgi:MtfA peptidase
MLNFLTRWFRRFRARRYPWREAWFQSVLHRVPALAALSLADRDRLRALVQEFLVEKQFHAANDAELTESLKVKIATLACLPALYLGYGVVQGWYDIVVYPDAFIATRSRTDAGGIVHEYRETLAGEAWQQGPIVLSAAAIERDLANPARAHSVVLHEIAHKIDGLDAQVDGVPPLPKAQAEQFKRALHGAFDDLTHKLQYGLAHDIDAYAAHSPEEFFAVATERYFLAPAALQQEYPALFAAMTRFYRPGAAQA